MNIDELFRIIKIQSTLLEEVCATLTEIRDMLIYEEDRSTYLIEKFIKKLDKRLSKLKEKS